MAFTSFTCATLASFGAAAGIADAVHAQTRPAGCESARVELDSELSEPWMQAVRSLCQALPSWKDVDPAAHVRITASGHDVIIEVVTTDGRSALRRVHAPEDLELGIEALITVPDLATNAAGANAANASPPASAPAAPEPPVTQVPVAAPQPIHAAAAAAPGPAPSTKLPVELGVAVLARMARSPTYLSAGAEAYAGIRTGRWLLALDTRWDPVQVATRAPYGLEMDSVGAGFAVSRRMTDDEDVALDLGMATTLLAETQGYVNEKGREVNDTEADMRVGVVPRLLFGNSGLRCTLSLEAEASPLHLRHKLIIAKGLPTLPSWGLGLGLGIAWEEL